MEQNNSAVVATLRYRAMDASWLTPHVIANIAGQSVESVCDELEQLVAEGRVTKRIHCGGGPAWVYHLVPKSVDLARKLGALDEIKALVNDHLAQTFSEIQADLRLQHEMGLSKHG